ncbi:MAG TPA: MFS transporter [Acidimicrobiaceae bacterium]|nr:MFS transporter [Acidimicrobiaceae bacterium]
MLQLAVVPGGLAMTSAFSVAALLGNHMTGSETRGALAAVCLSIGSSLAGVPLAALMARSGRRVGLRTGYLTGSLGAALGGVSALTGNYPLLIVGMLAVGTAQASNLAARYAGADLATDANRAASISLVLWAGTIGSVLGPTLALGVKSVFDGGDVDTGPTTGYVIPYAFSVVLFLVAAAVVSARLRPDPLHVAAADGAGRLSLPSLAEAGRIFAHPLGRVALSAMVLAQAVMVGIMTVTPIHMQDGGQSGVVIGVMMSIHISGMFAFSPLMGRLVDRTGGETAILLGAVALAVGSQIAAGTEGMHAPGHIWGLFLIGIGWSACIVAGSSLLTASFPVQRRVGVQATADVLMTTAGAAAGIVSGLTVEQRGYDVLSRWGVVFSLLLGALAATGVTQQMLRRGRRARRVRGTARAAPRLRGSGADA